jgi:hypothetical protein
VLSPERPPQLSKGMNSHAVQGHKLHRAVYNTDIIFVLAVHMDGVLLQTLRTRELLAWGHIMEKVREGEDMGKLVEPTHLVLS